jgi:hypothetical protein
MQCTELFDLNAVIRKCLDVLHICIALKPNHTSDKHSRKPITWLRHVPVYYKLLQ